MICVLVLQLFLECSTSWSAGLGFFSSFFHVVSVEFLFNLQIFKHLDVSSLLSSFGCYLSFLKMQILKP